MIDTYFINKTCTGVADTTNDSYDVVFTNLVREIISKIEQFLPDSFTYCGTPMEERTFKIVNTYSRYYFKYAIDGVPDMYYYIELYVTSRQYFIASSGSFCNIFTFMSQEDLTNIENNNEACSTYLLSMSSEIKCSFSGTTNSYYDSNGTVHHRTRISLSFNMGIIQNDNTLLLYFSNGDNIKNTDLHAGYTTINGEKYLMLYKAYYDDKYILYYSKDGDIYYSRGITYDLEGFDDPTKILALPVFLSTSNEDRAQIDPSLSPDGILECPNKSCSIGSKYIIDGKLYFALNNNILIED